MCTSILQQNYSQYLMSLSKMQWMWWHGLQINCHYLSYVCVLSQKQCTIRLDTAGVGQLLLEVWCVAVRTSTDHYTLVHVHFLWCAEGHKLLHQPAVGLMNRMLVFSWHTWQFSRSRRRERAQEPLNKVCCCYTNPDHCSPTPLCGRRLYRLGTGYYAI